MKGSRLLTKKEVKAIKKQLIDWDTNMFQCSKKIGYSLMHLQNIMKRKVKATIPVRECLIEFGFNLDEN